MKDKIKNGLIILLIVLIGLFGLFGGKKVKKYQEEISSLKYQNTALYTQKAFADTQIKFLQDTVKKKDAEIVKLMVIFKTKDRKVAELTVERDLALSRLNYISSDSSYIFLTKVAYNYPGALKYLFNELQVKYIHADYITARGSEKIIPVMTAQLNNCSEQFIIRDGIESGLKKVIAYQKQSLTDCEKINKNSDTIIKDTEKQRDKEKRRKNFWRFTTAVSTTVLIIIGVL